MRTVILEKENIKNYIYDCINSTKINGKEVDNAKYHHSTSYKNAISICKYGILTLSDMNLLGIRHDSHEFLKIMDDTDSHVNGKNSISLSIVGLNDIYPNEEEFDPFIPSNVDFLISDEIKAGRISTNYGNEFISFSSISKDYLKSVEVRLLKLISQDKLYMDDLSIEAIIHKYNYLKEIALELKSQQLQIPLREMSSTNISELNVDKIIDLPKILLKK